MALPVIECLLAIHVDVQHPVIYPERVLVGDADASHPGMWLAFAFRQAGRPVRG